MPNDLEWAMPELERAKTLYQQSVESNKSVNETWKSQGYRWRFVTWEEVFWCGQLTASKWGALRVSFALTREGWSLETRGGGWVDM